MRAGQNPWVARLLLIAPTAYFLLLVAYPLFLLVRMSFSLPERGRVFGEGFSFQNYIDIFTTPLFLNAFIVTVRVGILTAIFALLLGFPLAVFIWRSRGVWSRIVVLITLAPILISAVVRAYGWMVLLSNRGLVNSLLVYTGITDGPVRLIFNETGIVIGTVHVLLPFMVLSILSSLQTIDRSLEDAAATLGAKPWRVTLDIIFPLALPGAVAGLVLVFILAVGSFITPVLLGGQVVITLPILALQQFVTTFNWALGSAIVTVLLVAVLAATVAFERMMRRGSQRGTVR